MEMEFVQGVRMSEKSALAVGRTAKETKVVLSAHAPYFINLNAQEPEKVIASQGRLLHAVRIASLCGARNVVFHAAYYLNDPPEKVYSTVRAKLREVASKLGASDEKVWIRPETTGKVSQFGSLDEVIRLSGDVDVVAPCIDFAHLHARTGKLNSYAEFVTVLTRIANELGGTALENMHMHVSGIVYGSKGEIKHLNMKKSDFDYVGLVRALKDYDVKGLVISESPNLEEDALLLQETYTAMA
jgi:deoxyribonuclease-4